ncbi:hypothetical protein LNKW23_41930 [Paralimibaculum aggregatum]|uniref:Uncharacterized protein n=1 Tax=Paralimibaculum aggregatum TaxID=3036245 RepID=A0ABQ6LSC6_9RHOB|nr:hypothetical protein [Limibaculum sp. NKW23]GMG84977.1 hypothetical protein LNKW23_41930 [Limibaculum sp. NKW23]
MTKKQPEATFRDGALKLTVWKNEGQSGPFLTTTIARTYRTEAGHVADTQSLSVSDLPRIAALCQIAYARSLEMRRELAVEAETLPLIEEDRPRSAFARGTRGQAPDRPHDRRSPR